MEAIDLRELMSKRGVATRHAGVHEVTVIAFRHGRRMPAPASLRKLSSALGVETEVVWAACQESVRRAAAPADAQPGQA